MTPAKNEEIFLQVVADSIVKQSIQPRLWVIVDDGSTDKTPEIITTLEENYPWIKGIQLPSHPRDLFFHYSYVCKTGFDFLIKYAEESKIVFDYIALIDADTKVEEKYFEKLLIEFQKDETLGIASGNISDQIDENIIQEYRVYYPRGTGRIWTKKCFMDTGGYLVEAAADSVSNIKAILKGYHIQLFNNIHAIQLRPTRGADNLWETYKKDGQLAYYMDLHPALIFMNIIYFSMIRPYYLGIPYFLGYCRSLFTRGNKIPDNEVRDYNRNKRLKYTIKLLLKNG